jgi:hypothetical protein
MRRRLLAAGLAGAASVAVAAAGGADANASSACRPAQLRAKMSVILGSAGAGNISYRLLLRNASATTCTVSGHPGLKLRDVNGHGLPTHVTGVPPGSLGVLVTLAPGSSAAAQLRFSPDVPGPGEQTTGPCERIAHTVRVTLTSPGNGSLIGPIVPPTRVCEHGSMTETNLSHA